MLNCRPIGKTNIWINEIPNYWICPSKTKSLTKSLESTNVLKLNDRLIVVELFIPHGAKYSYGLLGAEFTNEIKEESNSNCKVEVYYDDDFNKNNYNSEFISSGDIYCGLTYEYANELMKFLNNVKILFPGTLKFNISAHSLIASSPYLFIKCAELIFQILALPEKSIDINVLEKTLNEFKY